MVILTNNDPTLTWRSICRYLDGSSCTVEEPGGSLRVLPFFYYNFNWFPSVLHFFDVVLVMSIVEGWWLMSVQDVNPYSMYHRMCDSHNGWNYAHKKPWTIICFYKHIFIFHKQIFFLWIYIYFSYTFNFFINVFSIFMRTYAHI